MQPRRTKAGGTKKRPSRYDAVTPTSEPLALGLRAHRKGNYAAAIESYAAAIAVDASSLDAWMNLGSVAVLAGRAGLAIRAFDEAERLAPDHPRALRDAGIALAAVGRSDESLDRLARAVRSDPSLTGAALFLPRVARDAGKLELAGRYAREVVRSHPHDASAHLELHRVLFDDQDLRPAIHAAITALELDPDYALARYFLAGAHAVAGELDLVERICGGGAVAPGLADGIHYATSRRTTATRFFAHKRDTLCFALARAEIHGSVLELGVRHGASLRWLAEVATEDVHGFDSFVGLPLPFQGLDRGAFTTDGELPDVAPHVALHVGLFEETLRPFVARASRPLRLLHVDSDLYESAALGLDALSPLFQSGTVIVFDEYLGNESWRQDEHRALEEASARLGFQYEMFAASFITGQVAVRIR